MEIRDLIYGNFDINEPVLIELIDSKPLQRIKRIAQYGIPKEYYPLPGFNRYEHCVGVMLLLKKLGADLEEQVAGLLHDVSHTAFSHLIDWVVGDPTKENYQDLIHNVFIRKTEIPEIIARHGLNLESVLDEHRHGLLEREAPKLCVDRLDYSLREFHYWANPKIVGLCLDNLIVHNNEVVLASKEAAESFGRNYMKLQKEHWGDSETVLRYYLFSKALKLALEKNIISQEDFYEDDDYVMTKLIRSNNPQVHKLLNILRGDLDYKIVDCNPQISLKKKFRYVDPRYIEGSVVYFLSEKDSKYRTFLEEQRMINQKGVNVDLLF